MLLHLTDFSKNSLDKQISDQLTARILDGDLETGARLISIGELSRKQHVNKRTVQHAFSNLEQKGLIYTHSGDYYISQISERQKQNLIKEQNTMNYPEQAQLTEELNMARQIQNALLPKTLPVHSKFSVAAYTRPSKTIGGDFYDCFQLDEQQYAFIIGDACGSGMPAAMVISQVQAIIKSSVQDKDSVSHLMNILNRHLKNNTSPRTFATLFYGIYNSVSRELFYSNAGHNYPLIFRNNMELKYLKTTAPALGIFSDINCSLNSVKLHQNDLLVLYTDGIIDVFNPENEQYGEERFIKLIKYNSYLSTEEIISATKYDINLFVSGVGDQDDQTILLLKIKSGFNDN